jgi:hypothetical protein
MRGFWSAGFGEMWAGGRCRKQRSGGGRLGDVRMWESGGWRGEGIRGVKSRDVSGILQEERDKNSRRATLEARIMKSPFPGRRGDGCGNFSGTCTWEGQ